MGKAIYLNAFDKNNLFFKIFRKQFLNTNPSINLKVKSIYDAEKILTLQLN